MGSKRNPEEHGPPLRATKRSARLRVCLNGNGDPNETQQARELSESKLRGLRHGTLLHRSRVLWAEEIGSRNIMAGRIHQYLAEDHRRLEELLRRTTETNGLIDPQAYWEFRGGLLRHIAMEEKILLPAAQAARGGGPLPAAAKLRLDHGALAALLVLTPSPSIVSAIRSILAAHNPLEEGDDGVYSQCEQLAGTEADHILSRLQNAPAVAMAPYVDSPIAIRSAHDAVLRAGYDLSF